MSICRLIIICTVFYLIICLHPCKVIASDIVINEFMPHPESSSNEWVEFSIVEGFKASEYWIDDDNEFVDDSGSSKKISLQTAILSSDGLYLTIELSGSMLNNAGDQLYLFNPQGVIIDSCKYDEDPGPGISIGRSPNKEGNFQKLVASTRGAPNTLPLPTVTPTLAPTEKPTRTPTPLPTPHLDEESDVITTINPTVQTKTANMGKRKVASRGAYPSPLLRKISPTKADYLQITPSKGIMVKSAVKGNPVFFSIGGFAFISCAILLFLKQWRR